MAADAKATFEAVITARDDASKTLDNVSKHVRKLSEEQEHAGKSGGKAFSGLYGHLNILRGHFGRLGATIGQTAGSLSEFAPALAGLGAAGSLVGLFELTERVSEAQAGLSHMATIIGLPVAQLQRMNYAAKMTDTSVEGMDTALGKLNKGIAEGGKNKDVASLFHKLGISTKDAQGHLRSAADLMPQLADAFAHTTAPAERVRMAMALFGKAGKDMIPMMMLGKDKLAELMAEASKVGYVNKGDDGENAVKYADSMKKMRAAAEGFSDMLGAKLAPVLRPVIDSMTDWIIANREWMTTEISGTVKKLGDWLRSINWKAISKDVGDFARGTLHLINHFGGLGTAIGAVGLVLGAEFTAKLYETSKIMKEITEVVWGPVIEGVRAFAVSMTAGTGVVEGFGVAMNAVFAASPWGIALIALAGAAYLVWDHWGWLKEKFTALYDWFESRSPWAKAILECIPFIGLPLLIMDNWGGIQSFFVTLWAGVKEAFIDAWVGIKAVFGWMIDLLDTVWDKFDRLTRAKPPKNALAKIGAKSVEQRRNYAPLDDLGTMQVDRRGRTTISGLTRIAPIGAALVAGSAFGIAPLQVDRQTVYSPYSSHETAAPAPNGSAAGPTAGQVDVRVMFANLPDGAQVSTKSSGAVRTTVSRSGTAWPDTHLAH